MTRIDGRSSWTVPPVTSSRIASPTPNPPQIELLNVYSLIEGKNLEARVNLTKAQRKEISEHLALTQARLDEQIIELCCTAEINDIQIATLAAVHGHALPSLDNHNAIFLYNACKANLTEQEQNYPSLTLEERLHETTRFLIDCFQACAQNIEACAQNNFVDSKYRWMANIINTTAHIGINVCISVLARELLGFAIARAMEDQPLMLKEVLGLSHLMLGISLNMACLGRELCNGTSTRKTILSRTAILASSIAMLILASVVQSTNGPGNVAGEMAAVAPQTILYTGIRDPLHLFFPLQSNTSTPLNWATALVGASAYSFMQFLLGQATSAWFKNSGATATQFDFQAWLAVALGSALVEVLDGLVINSARYYTGTKPDSLPPPEGLRIKLNTEKPDLNKFLDQVGTCSLRTSLFASLTTALTLVDPLLNHLSETNRNLSLGGVTCLLLITHYPPFVFAHAKRNPDNLQERVTQHRLSSIASPVQTRGGEVEETPV